MNMRNIAYIDWQNLHFWTKKSWWKIDVFKFRIFLRDRLQVDKAYYCLGCLNEDYDELYQDLQEAWFIVTFREHSAGMKGKKKWNVDTDIVFEIMKRLCEGIECFDKIVLVSWDGDYIKTVKYLIKKNKLKKIVFPNHRYSSLYNSMVNKFWMNLSLDDIRCKIQYIQENNDITLPV